MLTFIVFLLAGAATAALLAAHIRLGILEAAIYDLQRELYRDRIAAGRGKTGPILWHNGNDWDEERDYD